MIGVGFAADVGLMLRAANTRVVNHDTLPSAPTCRTGHVIFHSHAPEMSNLTTCAANTAHPRTMPMPADEGDQHRVIVAADSHRPGSPNID